MGRPRIYPEFCQVVGCEKPESAKGFCHVHYMRARRYGTPGGNEARRARSGDPLKFIQETALPFTGDECLKWPFSTTKGYGQVVVDGKPGIASRYICQLANGPSPSKDYEAAHSCGKGHLGCVNPRHLRWATPLENQNDKKIHGTIQRGQENHRSKLTENDVLEIRRSIKKGENQRRIAERYNVSSKTISQINVGKIWAWLPSSQSTSLYAEAKA